jgi:hypothetical protein
MGDASTENAARMLGYGTEPPWHRRRRWRAALVLLVVLMIGVVHRLWPRIAPRIAFLREQRVHLTHQVPPGTVLYTQAESLTYEGASAHIGSFVRGRTMTRWERLPRDFVDESTPITGETAAPGTKATGQQYDQELFLHERTSPAGHRRMVEVGLRTAWFHDGVRFQATVRLFEPGTFMRPRMKAVTVANRHHEGDGTIPTWHGGIFHLYEVPFGHSTTLSAAQPDPKDESAFLIRYVLDGQPGTIRGRLLDDDRVVFDGAPPAPQDLSTHHKPGSERSGTERRPE